ncbi:MAG: cyclic pyranopterin monophosphate synthase MoaC [Pseudomonadota bacterium]
MAGMIDVSHKKSTLRIALARGYMKLPPAAILLIKKQEIHTPKGPVFNTAILAGTQAVKKTADLLPYCHPIPLEAIKITIHILKAGRLQIDGEVKAFAKTGVEMEALCGVSIAALTIYDMLKYLSSATQIEKIVLIKKTGGKRDYEYRN